MCKALTTETESRSRALVVQANQENRPVLYVYLSDGWSCKMSSAVAGKCDGKTIRREGKVKAEFLLERSLLKSMSANGEVSTSIRLMQPRSLGKGKSGWNCFQAACQFDPLMRELCPDSVILQMVLQDGLHAGSMGRRMLARVELGYDCSENIEIAGDPEHPSRLTDCFLCVASHTSHQAQSLGGCRRMQRNSYSMNFT